MITGGRLPLRVSRPARTPAILLAMVTMVTAFGSVDMSAQYRSLYYQTVMTSGTQGASALLNPTALAWAPDGRLAVAQRDGRIHLVTIDNNLVISAVTRIDTIYDIGVALGQGGRTVTGIAFHPTDNDLYVSHSDGRLYNPSILQYSGRITRLVAPTFTSTVDIMYNLPRSLRDHGPNGLAFGPDYYLYLAQAGMTNAGWAMNADFWQFFETDDSASILRIHPYAVQSYTRYATGLRNPYKPLFHSNGEMYVNDNGPNAGAGGTPGQGIVGCTAATTTTPPLTGDELNRIVLNGFYGHPNPNRVQCIANPPGSHVAPIHVYGTNTSANGLAEYKSTAIPHLQGHIVTANYSTSSIDTVRLSGVGYGGLGPRRAGLSNPVDVVTSAAGNIFIAEFGGLGVSGHLGALRPLRTTPVDTDGDRRSDLTIYRPSAGTWYSYSPGTGVMTATVSGSSADLPRPTDYDGDSKMDAVSWNPSTGVWTIKSSSNQATTTFAHGGFGDIPVSADFDGDARGDQSIFRPSNGTWYVRYANTGAIIGYQWGGSGDIPRIMDIDNDGRSDLAVFRPSTAVWHIVPYGSVFNPYNPATGLAVQFGAPTDVPVPADYDGDGKTDIAVFRPSTGEWFILPAANGFNVSLGYTVLTWGTTGDVPRPMDWDGDGRSDVVIWRPSTGVWWILLSSTNYATWTTYWHGGATDFAVDPVY